MLETPAITWFGGPLDTGNDGIELDGMKREIGRGWGWQRGKERRKSDLWEPRSSRRVRRED